MRRYTWVGCACRDIVQTYEHANVVQTYIPILHADTYHIHAYTYHIHTYCFPDSSVISLTHIPLSIQYSRSHANPTQRLSPQSTSCPQRCCITPPCCHLSSGTAPFNYTLSSWPFSHHLLLRLAAFSRLVSSVRLQSR